MNVAQMRPRPVDLSEPPRAAAPGAPVTIGPGTSAHAPTIDALIKANLEIGHLLPRTLDDLVQHAHRFLVLTDLKLPVMDRVFGVKPFPVEDKPIRKHRFKDGALHCGPLFEKIILRMHALSDFVATTLEHHSARLGEVEAYIGAVELVPQRSKRNPR